MNAFEQVAVGANASASKGDEGESTAGFTEGLPQLNQYDHLDKDLWRWVDNDPDARASSAFTNAGLIGSVNGRRSLLAVGIICFLGCFYFFATCDDTLCSWGIISVLYAATWTVVTNVLVWMHYPIHAMNFFSLGFLPFAAMYSVNAVCDCSCSAAHSAICWLHDDIRDNCVAGGLWPNATLDDTRGGGGGSGSSGVMGDAAGIQSWSKVMAGTCYSEIYVALGAFVMVVLFRLYPRQQVYTLWAVTGAVFMISGVTQVSFGNISDQLVIFFGLGPLSLAILGFFYYRRSRAVKFAYTLIDSDSAGYASSWVEHSSSDPESANAIADLAATWERVKPSSAAPSKLQVHTQLSKLYRHAHVVNVWFQNVVKRWQQESNADPDAFKFTDIKEPARAIEKIRRTYFGVVARVTDVVRASIVVENVAAVNKILEVIANDPSVTILRGKNRFDVNYPAKTSGGYRDFQLLLRCTGADVPAAYKDDAKFVEECQMTCAEVQIHVKSILEFKNESGGHDGYTRFRKIMAQ